MTVRKPESRSKKERAERLAAALKENLRRRKAQARGRAAPGSREQPVEAGKDPKQGQQG